MSGNITFTIIKPYAVEHGFTGSILAKINNAGFKISAMKYLQMSTKIASDFYAIHKERPFFNRLVSFMSSGPVVVAILEKEHAVNDYRMLIGATDPSKAEKGTIRQLFGQSIQQNAVHGSDSDENAQKEADYFFAAIERF